MMNYGSALSKHPNVDFRILDPPRQMIFPAHVALHVSKDIHQLILTHPRIAEDDSIVNQTVCLAAKFYFLANFFLQKTQSSWLFRGTDDTWVNIELLDDYINDLEKEGNPKTIPIIRGSCVHVWGISYLQGGSGYLISRKAVENMMPFLKEFVSSVKVPEDVSFNELIVKAGTDVYASSSSRFVGHGFYTLPSDIELYLRPQQHCPLQQTIAQSKCRHFVAPLNQLVFVHDNSHFFDDTWRIANMLFHANPAFYFFTNGRFPWICNSSLEWVDEWQSPMTDTQLVFGPNSTYEVTNDYIKESLN